MKHTFALLIKFLFTSIILYLVLGSMYGIPYSHILLTSIVVTIIGYIVDVYLLPRIGNGFTTISDFLIHFTIIWFIGTYLFDTDIGTGLLKNNTFPLFRVSFIAAIAISIGEWFFHLYIHRHNLTTPHA